jgi:hypothetical protein
VHFNQGTEMKLFVVDYVVHSKRGAAIYQNKAHQVITMCEDYKIAMKRVIDSEIDQVVSITASIANDSDIYLIK